MPKNTPQHLYKDAQKDTPEVSIKGALQVALKLHLFMILSKHQSVQYDSIKCEIKVKLYVSLEGTSEISF